MPGKRLVWRRPEQLLQPDVLETVLKGVCAQRQVRVVGMQRELLRAGVSGAQLERLRLEVAVDGLAGREIVPLIFKQIKSDTSWLMRSSGDRYCREVQIWQHGLLADAPRALCIPVLAAAYDTDTREGALLLADMTRWLGKLEDCFAVVSPVQWQQYLDHLARLHARYWGDARLKDARFALAAVEDTLLMLAPATIQAQLATGDPHPYLPVSRSGWEAFFTHAPASALSKVQRVLDGPAAFLADAATVSATLLHGDAWPPNMGMLPAEYGQRGKRARSRTILLDWALATAGPATFDPFWLLFAWRTLDTCLALLYYRERLMRHLARRGIDLSAAEWRLLVDLGVVRTVMTCGESMGQDVLFAANKGRQARAIAALAWWVNWAGRVIERRGWNR